MRWHMFSGRTGFKTVQRVGHMAQVKNDRNIARQLDIQTNRQKIMGPLSVNELISSNTNLFLAFIIGIGFGFVLEQSGFSSSRKLAGVFYGYDTVVLKVFFTAAITAMLGLLFFSLFGWVDLNLVYVNPTYLTSAIIGGIIMGAGFITVSYTHLTLPTTPYV